MKLTAVIIILYNEYSPALPLWIDANTARSWSWSVFASIITVLHCTYQNMIWTVLKNFTYLAKLAFDNYSDKLAIYQNSQTLIG